MNADYTILVGTIMIILLRRLHEAQSGVQHCAIKDTCVGRIGRDTCQRTKKWHPCNISNVWYCRICSLLVCWGTCHQQAIGRDLVPFHSDT